MALKDIGSEKGDFGGVKLNSLGDVLARNGQLFVDLTKRNLEQKHKNASFELMQSISFDIEVIGLTYRFTIMMEDYWEWVDKGRKPGKRPPLKPIIEWIFEKPSVKAAIGATSKGMKDMKMAKLGDIVAPKPILAAALGIQKKIGKLGTKGSNFFSDVVNDESILKLQQELSIALGKDIELDIADNINKK